MRKFTTLLVVFAIVCTMAVFPAQAANTEAGLTSTLSNTVNSDFEVNTDGWTFSGTGTYSISADKAWSGSKSLYLDASATSGFSQRHTVTAGEMLEFTVHANAISYSDKSFITIDIYSADDQKLTTKTTSFTPSVDSWGYSYVDALVPEGASYAIATFGINTGGKIYFDTAMLLQYPEEYAWEQIERTTTSTNIVTNADFETASGSGPANWNPMANKGAWGSNPYTLYSTDYANSGTQSVRLYGTGGYYPEITQTVTVEPLATYKFSMYAYFVAGKKCYARIVHYNSEGTAIHTQSYPESYKDTDDTRNLNEWTKIVKYFTIDRVEGATSISLQICTDGNLDVYVDDISLQKISDAELCSVDTDQWYYYTEWDGGTATVNVTDAAILANEGGTVKTYITKKGSSTKLLEITSAIASTISVPFTTAALAPSYGDEYIVTAEVYNASNTLVGSNTNYFHYYSRPTHLNENGDWIDDDGKAMEVVIGNAGTSEASLQVAKNIGVTVTTIGHTRNAATILSQLDLCEQYGIKAIVNLYSNANPCGRYPAATIDAINSVKDHPAVFAWGVQDEPYEIKNPYPGLRSSYQIIRDTDPDHPVYFVESCISYNQNEFKCADMLCIDSYCADRASYAVYAIPYLQEIAADAPLQHDKPTANIIQTFDWRNYFPTENEARHMMYQVLFAGVDYAGYYHLSTTDGIADPDHADFAAAIPPIAKVELPILYKLFRTDECTLLSSNVDSDSKIWYYIWKDGTKYYIAVLNCDPSNTQTATATVNTAISGYLTTYGNTTGSIVSPEETSVSMSLAPGAAAIYEYETERFPYEETFTANGYTSVTDATWANADGTEYQHPLHIPTGWSWRCTNNENTSYKSQAANTGTDRQRAVMYTASDDVTYLGMSGSDLAMTKMVDITPGYSYTITTDAYTLNSQARTGLSYWLYHKNADGTYTEINEYLTSNYAESLESAKATVTFNAANGTTVTWNGNDAALKGTLTLNVDVTDASVNAIMVGLGGYGGNSDHSNFRVYHPGFKVEQGGAVDIIPNLIYYHKEAFTSGAYSSVTASWANAEGTMYDHPLDIPTGWSWRCTNDENTSYKSQAANTSTDRQRSVMLDASDGITYLGMTGSDLAITKMVDIEPGYQYTVSTTAYTGSSAARTGLSYWFYHKNADGTYTEINEYLTSQGANALETTHAYTSLNFGNSGTTVTWNGNSSAKSGTLTLNFTITDADVNAVMIGIGGYGGNSDHRNYRVYHPGFEITQGSSATLISNPKIVYEEVFTNSYTTEEFTYNYNGTDYTNTADVPAGWTYALDGQYPQHAAAQKKLVSYSSGTPYDNSYCIFGSWVSLTKMIDIEPGYQYTITTTAAKYAAAGNNRVNTKVELYHKNDDGTYTEINEYLASENYENSSLANASTNKIVTTAETDSLIKNNFYDVTHTITLQITDASVDAIKIKLGGNNGQGYNNSGYYSGVKVIKELEVDMVSNEKQDTSAESEQ